MRTFSARAFPILVSLLTASQLAAQSTYYWTFNNGVLPHWTQQGVALLNCSGVPDYQVFSSPGGLLQQRTAANPTCSASFYGGSLPNGAPPTAAGLQPWLPTFAEARLRVLGGVFGTTGPSTVPILWLHAGGRSSLQVDLALGTIGVEHAGGVAWTLPPSGLGGMQTYSLEFAPNLGAPTIALRIDGALVIGPLPVALDWLYNGWGFGDGSSSNSIGIEIDWDHVSIVQQPPGIGQANSAEAMLFASSAYSSSGAPGLSGPFRVQGLGGYQLALEWSGPPGAPFALIAAPTLGLPRPIGCGGTVDIGTAAGFADIAVVFDPTVPVFGSFFMLNASGYSYQYLQIPPLPPGLLLGAIQGAVFQSSACGLRMTAAFELRS